MSKQKQALDQIWLHFVFPYFGHVQLFCQALFAILNLNKHNHRKNTARLKGILDKPNISFSF